MSSYRHCYTVTMFSIIALIPLSMMGFEICWIIQADKFCYLLGILYSNSGNYIIHQIFILNVTGGEVFVGLLYATTIMLYWSFDGYKEPVFSTIQQIKAQFYQNICLLATLDLCVVFFEPIYSSSSKPITELPRLANNCTTVIYGIGGL
jgi:hypothetical protein